MDAAPVGAGEPYRVCVVGAGGVGALFAARLADAGVTVHCIARGAHLAAIQRRGIFVKSFAGDATARQRRAARGGCARLTRGSALGRRCASRARRRRPLRSAWWT
jgi:choline dehydrogenase-like flavoprotein